MDAHSWLFMLNGIPGHEHGYAVGACMGIAGQGGIIPMAGNTLDEGGIMATEGGNPRSGLMSEVMQADVFQSGLFGRAPEGKAVTIHSCIGIEDLLGGGNTACLLPEP